MSQTTIQKTVLVPYSAERMYHLVDRAEDYPQFLPWYGRTEIISRTDTELKARLFMDYMGITQSFATRNRNTPCSHIHIDLLEGPFKSLTGDWHFEDLGGEVCKVDFMLRYELLGVLSRLIAPMFSSVTGKLVDAFVKEAAKRYG